MARIFRLVLSVFLKTLPFYLFSESKLSFFIENALQGGKFRKYIKSNREWSYPRKNKNHQLLLTYQNIFVFYEGATADNFFLNDEKFGMLCGNYIYIVR